MQRVSCRCDAGAAESLTPARTSRTGLLFIGLLVAALAIAGCAGGPPAGSRGAPAASHASGEYRVQRGDTLASIARRHGTDYPTLARLNGLRPPYTIYPGQRLRLPGGAPTPSSTPVADWRWPTAGRTVRAFSASHGGNKGLDIAGRVGQPVRAAAAGTVVYAGNGLRQYGNLLIVKHNADYLSAYGHLQQINVTEGSTVTAGQTIATMGSNGDGRGLLHFEIRLRGTPIDPARMLPPRGG
ncbi:MAG: amidase activator ActS [Immundisolibacter sp.]